MKLKPCGWALLAALSALPHFALAAKPSGVNASAMSPAYARDLRDIIVACQYYEMVFEMPLRNDMDPVKREFIEFFRKEATREELVRRFTPGLASVLNPQLASRIARLVETPVFGKRLSLIRHKQDDAGNYTAQEEAELLRIENDPAMTAFNAVLPKMNASLSDTIRRWNADFNKQLRARVEAIFEKLEQDLEAARAAGDGRIVTIGSTGYAPFDDYNNAMGAGMILMSTAMNQFEDVEIRLGMPDYLDMHNLVDQARIAEAGRVIDQLEQAWDLTQSQNEAALKDIEGTLNNSVVRFDPELGQLVSKQYFAIRKYIASNDIIMRRLFAQYRDIAKFMETNHGGIRLEDGVLIFANKEILRRADELDDKLIATGHELEDVQAQFEAALRGVLSGTPTTPKKRHRIWTAKKT